MIIDNWATAAVMHTCHWLCLPQFKKHKRPPNNHVALVSFLSSFPQSSLQPEHAGDAVKEKVEMPMYLKPREALLTVSYRNPGVKFSPLALKKWGVSCLFATQQLDRGIWSAKDLCCRQISVHLLIGHAEICKLLLQSRREYKFTATIYKLKSGVRF